MAVVAGAGTGKTTTLALLAENLGGRVCRYVAFNKAVVEDSAARFPDNVVCSTAHSLAYQATGRAFRRRLNSPRLPSADIAALLGIDPLAVGDGPGRRLLTPAYLAGVAMQAVKNFAHSAEPEPGPHHVPYIDGIDLPDGAGRRGWANNTAVRTRIAPALRRAWADLSRPDGRLTYSHDFYLKAYQLIGPRIDADVVLVDEAQDLSPVLADIVAHQTHCQLILVGDPYQSIYGWLGAVDAMNTITVDTRCYLTHSFRFGPAIAEIANHLLGRLHADLRLKGQPTIDSTVGHLAAPRAVLTRTNAEALRQLLHHLQAGRSVALVGGNSQLAAFCQAAAELADTGTTGHPDLACFTSWEQVVDYADHDHQGGELKLLVQLIERFGAPAILDALTHTTAEDTAQVVLSTAHKSKGREWDTVALAGDYPAPKTDRADNPAEELRLLYVAATRARHHLDPTRVPHATRHPDPKPAPAPSPAVP
jgi:superfamily I DNA/RNA helicase